MAARVVGSLKKEKNTVFISFPSANTILWIVACQYFIFQ